MHLLKGELEMLEGTKSNFKLLYFVSSMFPSYILFLFNVYNTFNNTKETNGYYILIFIIIVIVGVVAAHICKSLIINTSNSETGKILRFTKVKNIKNTKNGNVISFVLSTIMSSVFIFDNSFILTFCSMILIQFALYFLLMHTDEIFPNALLILLGIDFYKVEIVYKDEKEFLEFETIYIFVERKVCKINQITNRCSKIVGIGDSSSDVYVLNVRGDLL